MYTIKNENNEQVVGEIFLSLAESQLYLLKKGYRQKSKQTYQLGTKVLKIRKKGLGLSYERHSFEEIPHVILTCNWCQAETMKVLPILCLKINSCHCGKK